ncbi:hypothetical protein ACQP1W_38895 [Spirillospora sp. CA-255316]
MEIDAPLAKLVADLAAIDDTTERAQAAGRLLNALIEVQQEIKAIRQADVAELRKTLKLREVADLLGVTTARVDQISKARS